MPSCLFLHGLGGGPYELGPVIGAVAGLGWEVAAPVLPGHEGPGRAMPPSRWEDWIAAAEAAFDRLAGPVAVVGFSTGATLALELATRRAVDRLALLAPFLAIRYSALVPLLDPAWTIGLVARFLPDLPRRGPAVRDRSSRRTLAAESAGFRTFNLGATLSALELIARVEPKLGSIRCPTLILQGALDTVVEPASAARLLAGLGTEPGSKSLAWLDRSDHLLAHDRDREAVIAMILEFLLGGGVR